MSIETIIEETNLKRTSARKELLKLFHEYKKPISFEDVKEFINMDKATFYRNVSKFQEESIISSFESNDKKRYYELRDNPHAHFICNACNAIECLTNVKLPTFQGYKIVDNILKGLCKNCNVEHAK